MNRWLFVAAVTILFGLAAGPLPARAGLHFCNKTGQTIYIAISISEDCTSDTRCVHTRGWWKAEPGRCATPIDADLQWNSDYDYYAEDAQNITWRGSDVRCVDPSSSFDYLNSNPYECSTTRRFRYVKVNGQSDYTIDITPSTSSEP